MRRRSSWCTRTPAGRDRPRLHLRRRVHCEADREQARRRGGRHGCGRPATLLGGDGQGDTQPRAAGDRVDGDLGRGSRALGSARADTRGSRCAWCSARAHDRVPVYGSGGFTSYSEERLQAQLAGWVEQGIPRVKIKVGADPAADPRRVALAREAIGPGHRAVRGRQRRLRAQAGARSRRSGSGKRAT